MQNCDLSNEMTNVALCHHLVSVNINFKTKGGFQDTKFCKKCKALGSWFKLKENCIFSGKSEQDITDKITN